MINILLNQVHPPLFRKYEQQQNAKYHQYITQFIYCATIFAIINYKTNAIELQTLNLTAT